MIDASLPAVRILQGDCLQSLADLDDGAADLVYMDPPFNTGHAKRAQGGAFADDWKDIDAYLSYMRPRIEQCRRVLHENGSILLHCDWRTVHHFRLMLDEFFGPRSHVNHLIWRYGLGGSSPRRFARKHDDILFHARSDAYYFQAPRVPATSQRMKGQTKKSRRSTIWRLSASTTRRRSPWRCFACSLRRAARPADWSWIHSAAAARRSWRHRCSIVARAGSI